MLGPGRGNVPVIRLTDLTIARISAEQTREEVA